MLPVDSFGRVLECVNCGHINGIQDKDATYCINCGYSLLNRCTNAKTKNVGTVEIPVCQRTLPPEANYCPFCGSESIFNRIRSSKESDDLPF